MLVYIDFGSDEIKPSLINADCTSKDVTVSQ